MKASLQHYALNAYILLNICQLLVSVGELQSRLLWLLYLKHACTIHETGIEADDSHTIR